MLLLKNNIICNCRQGGIITVVDHIYDNRIIQINEVEFETHPDFVWIDCLDDCDTTWSYIDGQCVHTAAAISLTDSKALKMAEINRACDLAISALATDFPQTEVQSWDQQVREADQWMLDNNVPVPLIAAISAARELPLGELVARIKAKAVAFAAASGAFIGKRQSLEDQLILLTEDTPDVLAEVENIKW